MAAALTALQFAMLSVLVSTVYVNGEKTVMYSLNYADHEQTCHVWAKDVKNVIRRW